MNAPQFPPLAVLQGMVASGYDKDFVAMEFGPGLDYYVGRLDRLCLRGGRVLDAGCGMGQWSLALSRRFARVDGVEINAKRLAIASHVAGAAEARNLFFHRASIERLPFAAGVFDAVFCYGVIMFVDVAAALAEFCRVLAPGGRVYCCLNADGWSRYLADDMGRDKPAVRAAGLDTLYTTYWRRAFADGLAAALALQEPLRRLLDAAGEAAAAALLDATPQGRRLAAQVRASCGEAYAGRFARDGRACVADAARFERSLQPTRAYMPEEFKALAEQAGFADFQWHGEGLLVADWRLPPLAPKYPEAFAGKTAVWECTLAKPQTAWEAPRPEYFLRRARAAFLCPAYVEPAAACVRANGRQPQYPPRLYAEAQARARRAGPDFLAGLARCVTARARGEEEAFVALYAFVQQAVFRDPVCQPVDAAGDPAAPLVTLFTGRGRCGHAARLLLALCGHAGLEGRILQLERHVAAEIRVDGVWALADADAFKNGVLPRDGEGGLLTRETLRAQPWRIDAAAPTGWMVLPGDPATRGVFGHAATGYVDALPPQERGPLSRYYAPGSGGALPSLPRIDAFACDGGEARLSWTASRFSPEAGETVLGYRVAVRSRPRGWEYGGIDPAFRFPDEIAPADVCDVETDACRLSFALPPGVGRLYAEVTPVTARSRAFGLYLWPSPEAALRLGCEEGA